MGVEQNTYTTVKRPLTDNLHCLYDGETEQSHRYLAEFRLINLSRQWAENQLCDNRKVFDKCNKWSRWNQKGWRGKCKNPDRLELITCPLIIWVLNSVGKWDSKKAPELVYIWEKRISLQTYSFTIHTKYMTSIWS